MAKLALLAVLAVGWEGATALRLTRSATHRQTVRCQATTRRDLLIATPAVLASPLFTAPSLANAAALSKEAKSTVLVAGSTGKTGSRVVSRLAPLKEVAVVQGVRKEAGDGARKVDVQSMTTDQLASALEGVDAVVCAIGFVPANPLQMGKAAHEVDNLGTIKLIDASMKAGVNKFVLVSSILTDGRSWGQEKSPGFVITNAFGGVLDEKIFAERYLRKSTLDYTIVRPGGLQDKATGEIGQLVPSGENTLNSGEISRDTVADVCVQALFAPDATNRVIEIFEDKEAPPTAVENWFKV